MVCGIKKAISPQIEDICGKIFCPSLKVFISQAIIPAVLLMSSRLLLFGAKLKSGDTLSLPLQASGEGISVTAEYLFTIFEFENASQNCLLI